MSVCYHLSLRVVGFCGYLLLFVLVDCCLVFNVCCLWFVVLFVLFVVCCFVLVVSCLLLFLCTIVCVVGCCLLLCAVRC